ncbi:hypothetical protein FOXB_16495, partial [Fusarium oxysporum f. sp. conglutinans Fo5176]
MPLPNGKVPFRSPANGLRTEYENNWPFQTELSVIVLDYKETGMVLKMEVVAHISLLSCPFADHMVINTNWSRFAYAQYVTNSEYLCNSVMLFEALQHLRNRADRVMIYPSHMLGSDYKSSHACLLVKAREKYDVKLIPIAVRHKDNAD